MTADEYQDLATRTECSQAKAGEKLATAIARNDKAMRLMHAACGMSAESGEVQGFIQKWLWYGQQLDIPNIILEIGDLLWYTSLACRALDTSIEEVMAKNIAKLSARYPEKYTDHLAMEENRNRDREKDAAWSYTPNLQPPHTNQGN